MNAHPSSLSDREGAAMSIADSIREAVACGHLHHLQDSSTVENKVLSAFMQKGDYFDHTAHALDFALLVASAIE